MHACIHTYMYIVHYHSLLVDAQTEAPMPGVRLAESMMTQTQQPLVDKKNLLIITHTKIRTQLTVTGTSNL